jgi:hypothetical protein
VRELANEIEEQLPRAAMHQDLPRGRKRPGWKRNFARSLESTAGDLVGVTESKVVETTSAYRADKKRLPEITVVGSRKSA